MKKIILIFTITSLTLRAADFNGTGASNYTDDLYNCSITPQPFSDLETMAYAGFQIGAGIFALIFLASNFCSASFYYKREAKSLARLLNSHKEELTAQNIKLKNTNIELVDLINEIDQLTDEH